MLLEVFDVAVQLIEAAFPERALLYHPMLGSLQRLRRELVGSYPSRLARSNHSALLQNIEVLREGRQSHVEWLRKLARSGGAAAQPFEDGPSCRVGQGLKNAIQLHGLVRHAPNFTPSRHLGQYLFSRYRIRTPGYRRNRRPAGGRQAPNTGRRRRTQGQAPRCENRTSAIQLRALRARRDSMSSPSKLAVARRSLDGSTFSNVLTLTTA